MRVVVAGGSGLIGRALVSSLAADEHDVVVLTRRPQRVAAQLPQGVRIVGWDPAAPSPDLPLLLANATAVVNLCGASVGRWPWTGRRRQALRDSRLQPTHALVDAIAALPPSEWPAALLNASGSDFYEGRDEQPATEQTPPTGTFLARLCSEWEGAARRAEELDVRVVLLRPSLVLAPRAPALERLALPVRLLLGGRLGSGRQWVSWIALEDAVGLLRRAIVGWDIDGPLNLVAPGQVRQSEFVGLLARVLRRPARLPMPAWLVRLVLGRQSTLVLGSRRVAPAKALASSYQFRMTDLEVALRNALGRPA
ncbi:MAG TPA: TIGR01777 family oxidoreductase [Candidatus Limnocylindria bacterium]|nr:TIGR01777 family oxidoreductase [Candidatus Limnocylindria bacterium]